MLLPSELAGCGNSRSFDGRGQLMVSSRHAATCRPPTESGFSPVDRRARESSHLLRHSLEDSRWKQRRPHDRNPRPSASATRRACSIPDFVERVSERHQEP